MLIGKPAFVTVPTPSPALKIIPELFSRTLTMISAPCVTSGSSPASFVIPTSAHPSPLSVCASGNIGFSPLGNVMVTSFLKPLPHKASNAAFVAAVAHAPVVQPRRRSVLGFLVIKLYYINLLHRRQFLSIMPKNS